jgi:hypothetical protein
MLKLVAQNDKKTTQSSSSSNATSRPRTSSLLQRIELRQVRLL